MKIEQLLFFLASFLNFAEESSDSSSLVFFCRTDRRVDVELLNPATAPEASPDNLSRIRQR